MQSNIASSAAPAMGSNYTAVQVCVALTALAMGVLVYLVDRIPDSVYFLSAGWSLSASYHHLWFGDVGGQLPQFVHVYAFALLTAAALPPSRLFTTLGCAAWWVVDSLFEIGQHPAVHPVIVPALPGWLKTVPFLENTGPYLTRGTFDPLDLAAIAAGAVAAYCTIIIPRSQYEDRRYAKSS